MLHWSIKCRCRFSQWETRSAQLSTGIVCLPKSSCENTISLSLYWMMMNRDSGAEDYVEFRLVDTTGSLTQLISWHGPDLPFFPGADLFKSGNLSRGVQRLPCLLPFLAKGSQVKSLLFISWLFVTFGISIYQQVLFTGWFWAALSPVTSELMLWFLAPALRDVPLSWKVSVVCTFNVKCMKWSHFRVGRHASV